MNTREDDFIRQLRATFMAEAAEHLRVIATGLLELEKMPDADEERSLVETMFRAAHSLKGAARAVDIPDIASQCQALENMFATWKRQEHAPCTSSFDAARRTLNAIGSRLSASETAL